MDEENKALKLLKRKENVILTCLTAPIVLGVIGAAVLALLDYDRVYYISVVAAGLAPVSIYGIVSAVLQRNALSKAMSVSGWHKRSGVVTSCEVSSYIDAATAKKAGIKKIAGDDKIVPNVYRCCVDVAGQEYTVYDIKNSKTGDTAEIYVDPVGAFATIANRKAARILYDKMCVEEDLFFTDLDAETDERFSDKLFEEWANDVYDFNPKYRGYMDEQTLTKFYEITARYRNKIANR